MMVLVGICLVENGRDWLVDAGAMDQGRAVTISAEGGAVRDGAMGRALSARANVRTRMRSAAQIERVWFEFDHLRNRNWSGFERQSIGRNRIAPAVVGSRIGHRGWFIDRSFRSDMNDTSQRLIRMCVSRRPKRRPARHPSVRLQEATDPVPMSAGGLSAVGRPARGGPSRDTLHRTARDPRREGEVGDGPAESTARLLRIERSRRDQCT